MKQFFYRPVLWYLRYWARIAIAHHHPKIIGIAGSVGKSSTRNAIFALLKDYHSTAMVSGNSETGVPLGILGIKPQGYSVLSWLAMLTQAPFGVSHLKGITHLIVEMGIDDPNPPKNMSYLLTIVKPDIALSLNISATHTQQFEKALSSKEHALPEKEKLTKILHKMAEEDTKIITQSNCTMGIYNHDDPFLAEVMQNLPKPIALQTFGKERTNTVSYTSYTTSLSGTNFSFLTTDTKKRLELQFKHSVLPEVYQEVFAAAILTGIQLGLSLAQIKRGLEKNYRLPKGRASLFEGINKSVIIDSSYNSSSSAVISFLELLDRLKKSSTSHRETIFLMGDMRELGEEAEIEHKKVMEALPGKISSLYCVGPLTREYVISEIENHTKKLKDVRWFNSAKRAGEYLREHLPENALVLVKGSQNTLFLEEAIKYLLKNKDDEKNLCRQEEYWKEIKKKQSALADC